MTITHHHKSAASRVRANHPIIDFDGRTVEFEPAFLDYLRQVGGPAVVKNMAERRWAERIA